MQRAILSSSACIQDGANSVARLVSDRAQWHLLVHRSGKTRAEEIYKHTLITCSYWEQKGNLGTSFICKKNILGKHLLIKEEPGFNSGPLQAIPYFMSETFTLWTLHWQTPSNKCQTSRWQLLFHFIISEFSGMQKGLPKVFSAVGNKFCFF